MSALFSKFDDGSGSSVRALDEDRVMWIKGYEPGDEAGFVFIGFFPNRTEIEITPDGLLFADGLRINRFPRLKTEWEIAHRAETPVRRETDKPD